MTKYIFVITITLLLIMMNIIDTYKRKSFNSYEKEIEDHITVATLNIKLGFDNDTRAINMMEKMRDKDIDIFCLQENFKWFGCIGGYSLRNWGIKNGYNYISSKNNSGLVILSRYKVLKVYHECFGNCYLWDYIANKGVLIIELVNGLKILNTHLQADYGYGFEGKIIDKQLCKIFEIANQNNVDIICGDLNKKIHNDVDVYKRVETHREDCIDHIFHNGNIDKYEVVDIISDESLTDHDVVISKLYIS